jgi:hypothetical protein
MPRSETTRWIKATPKQVFTYLLDFAAYPSYCDIVRSVRCAACPLRAGDQSTLFLPHVKLQIQVVNYQSPYLLDLTVCECQQQIQVCFQCEAVADGALVSRQISWDGKPGLSRTQRMPQTYKLFDLVTSHIYASALPAWDQGSGIGG